MFILLAVFCFPNQTFITPNQKMIDDQRAVKSHMTKKKNRTKMKLILKSIDVNADKICVHFAANTMI